MVAPLVALISIYWTFLLWCQNDRGNLESKNRLVDHGKACNNACQKLTSCITVCRLLILWMADSLILGRIEGCILPTDFWLVVVFIRIAFLNNMGGGNSWDHCSQRLVMGVVLSYPLTTPPPLYIVPSQAEAVIWSGFMTTKMLVFWWQAGLNSKLQAAKWSHNPLSLVHLLSQL